ncbi:MAG TPA: hypothetical protein VK039_06695 [Brevibacterium sp.]|nr:hypothetical protein [Brevibacterium sp.]
MNDENPTPDPVTETIAVNGPVTSDAPRKGFFRRTWPLALTAVVCLSVGAAAGAVGTEEDAPAGKPAAAVEKDDEKDEIETVTVQGTPETVEVEVIKEVEVEVEVPDPTCAQLAMDYRDMLMDMTEKVALPYSDVVIEIVDMMQYGADAGRIQAQTAALADIGESTEDITARVTASAGVHAQCQDQL